MPCISEIGNRYGKLVVIQRAQHRSKNAHWLCKCNCGNSTIVDGSNLRRGQIKGCGCLIGKSHFKNEVGNKYGLLTVKSIYKRKQHIVQYKCICKCGNETTVSGGNLRKGVTTSCGCRQFIGFSSMWGKQPFPKGKHNPMWRGGSTLEQAKIRTSKKYKEWRKDIFVRDNFACLKCKQIGKKLAAHHIESFDINKDRRLDKNNGVCLCYACHKKFHDVYGRGNNTNIQFQEFMVS